MKGEVVTKLRNFDDTYQMALGNCHVNFVTFRKLVLVFDNSIPLSPIIYEVSIEETIAETLTGKFDLN